MDYTTRWIGGFVARPDVEAGDLVVIENGIQSFLCLVGQIGHDNIAVILREFGQPSGDSVPGWVHFESIAHSGSKIRRIVGDIVIEPIEATAECLIVPPNSPSHNGCLAFLDDGSMGIYLRGSSGRGHVFDFTTGQQRTTAEIRMWQRDWRLIWQEGDQGLELFSSPLGLSAQ